MPTLTNDVLYEHYRTIAYGNANPLSPEHLVSGIDATFAKLLPSDRNARILDIGCGMGQFIQYLLAKGYKNVSGVELSPEQVEFCRNNVTQRVDLVSNTVDFLAERPESSDCIVFLDVIEHLPRSLVIPTLSAMFSALAPGGSVIIETGNLASWSGMFVRHIDFTHESGFTENSMKQVLRAVGFGEISVSGNVTPIYSWRSYLKIAAQRAWYLCQRALYSIDRGWDFAPKILAPLLIARAVRK